MHLENNSVVLKGKVVDSADDYPLIGVSVTVEGQSVEIPYSNATETTVHLASAAFLYEDIDCTLAAMVTTIDAL